MANGTIKFFQPEILSCKVYLLTGTYRKIPQRLRLGRLVPAFLHHSMGRLLTFLLVVIAWVFFRADNLRAARVMLTGMFGLVPGSDWNMVLKSQSAVTFNAYLIVSLSVIWLLPNIYEMLDFLENHIEILDKEGKRIGAMVTITGGVVCALLFCASIASTFGYNEFSPFIYFQF
jgi:alginate O-acetyltransferase complex protein AlgI